MRSSHVGSFPLDYGLSNIEIVLLDLNGIGLDVPPYPQLRGVELPAVVVRRLGWRPRFYAGPD